MDSRFQEGPLGHSTFTDITSTSFPSGGEEGKQLQQPRRKGGRYGELKGAGGNKDDEMCTICHPPPFLSLPAASPRGPHPWQARSASHALRVAFPLQEGLTAATRINIVWQGLVYGQQQQCNGWRPLTQLSLRLHIYPPAITSNRKYEYIKS